MAMGFLIRALADIPVKGRVLDCGIGWGNTTVAMARSGFEVTAVDVDDNFIELVKRRSEMEHAPIEIIKGDFTEVMTELADAGRQFDAVVFFESFHHSADHHALIAAISRVVAPNGLILFATEAIYDDFPIPWGLRMDGESLWAIRRNGWMELGFNSDYFAELLRRHGWVGTFLDARSACPTAYAIVARRLSEIVTSWTYDSGLHHNVGTRTDTGVSTDATAGALAFGPYAALPKGRWAFEVLHDPTVVRPFGNLVVELAADRGATVLGQQLIRLLPLRRGPIKAEFELPRSIADLEIRLHVGRRSRLHVTGIKATALD
jgi:ubiquinone/menaquinone biosynthesis C-methylase UbiE